MRVRLSLFGGNLFDFEINTGSNESSDETESDPQPFGFTGRCDGLELATDRDPLTAQEVE